MDDLLFKGVRLIDPAGGTDAVRDVHVRDGTVAAVGETVTDEGAEVIDGDGLVMSPGFVDLHVHLREPGREDEETIESASAGAALGGFNAVVAMPNTDPVCDNAAVAEKVAARGRLVGMVQVLPAGAITVGQKGEDLAPIGDMAKNAGVRVFTDDGHGVQDAALLRRAMEYMRGLDVICAEHCEDAALSRGGHMHEGEFSSALGLTGIPAAAEEVALARDLSLAKLTGVHFHALHVSTAGSVELIRRAKQEGLRVTAEAAPHHFSLTDAELVTYDTNFKVNPPLRGQADVEAVRQGLADGTIDAVATDHAPHSREEKEAEFESAPPGMLGLETALAVVLTELVHPGLVDLSTAVRLLSTRPAQILGLEAFGGPVVEGAPANLTVFDPEARWTVAASQLVSRSQNTPWAGRELTGRVVHTIFEGRRVVSDGRPVSALGAPA